MLIHDPVRWTPVESTGVHQTYIVHFLKVVNGQFVITSESSPADSNGLQWTPTYLDYSQISISRGFSPADSLDPLHWTTLNFFIFLFQWTPADSGGSNMWRYVTRLEFDQVRRNPAESGRVLQNMWGSVKYCYQLHPISYDKNGSYLWDIPKIPKLIHCQNYDKNGSIPKLILFPKFQE